MVGRINVIYKGKKTGCGPGKLTHPERTKLWAAWVAGGQQWADDAPKIIATIKAKRDPSYTGLRPPTFQHWREDKTEPNDEVIV
jgi:hypothetical protein